MSSFYGGKQGRTYNIIERFDSVADMIRQFAKGGAYNRVNYGEYVLIDTVKTTGKSNNQNGLLFRRGFDYLESPKEKPVKQNCKDDQGNFDQQVWQSAWSNWVERPGAGAIYVGQIVGPEGKVPEIDIEKLSQLKSQSSTFGQIHQIELDSTPGVLKTIENEQQISIYNDVIKSGYVNILDRNGEVIKGYITFDIPYTVTKVTAKSISPYGEKIKHKDYASGIQTQWEIEQKIDQETQQSFYENLINLHPYSGPGVLYAINDQGEIIYQEDEQGNQVPVILKESHPYYYDYQIAIPSGKQGPGITELKIQTGNQFGSFKYIKTRDTEIQSEKEYYELQQEEYILVQQPNIENIENYYEKILDTDQYLTYTGIDYKENAAGTKTEHLGRWPWRVIRNIATNFKERILYNLTQNISNCKLGDLALLPSQEGEQQSNEYYAICIKEGDHNPNVLSSDTSYREGLIFPEGDTENALWQVISNNDTSSQGVLNGPPHSFTIDYTAGDDYTFEDFRIVDYLLMDTKGNLYINYSNDNTYEENENIHDTLHLIGTIRQIENITFTNQDNIQTAQQIVATYRNGQSTWDSVLSDHVNRILDIQNYGDSAIVLYSDPARRDSIPEEKVVYREWTNPLTTTSYNSLRWQKLGPIGAQYHVLGEVSLEQLKDENEYKNGIPENTSREGWLLTCTYQNVKYIFAYDYLDTSQNGKYELPDGTPTHWYEVMSASESLQPKADEYIIVKNSLSSNEINNLKEGGIWLVVSERHNH